MDKYLYNRNDTPPTDAEVARMEQKLGYRLPPDFMAFVKDAASGVPMCNRIILPDDPDTGPQSTSLEVFDDFFDLDERLALIRRNYVEERLPPLLAFASDGTGNYFCLHLGTKNYGAVSFLEHEEGALTHLAPSFTEFLALIQENNDPPPVIKPGDVISVAGASLEEIDRIIEEIKAEKREKRRLKRQG